MTTQTITVKGEGGGSGAMTAVKIAIALSIVGGIAFVMYIFFSEIYGALSGVFNWASSAASTVASYVGKCFGKGGWEWSCLGLYLGIAFVGLFWAATKLASKVAGGDSDVATTAAFETERTVDAVCDSYADIYERNKEMIDAATEDMSPAQADLYRRTLLTEQAVAEAKTAADNAGSPLDQEAQDRMTSAAETTANYNKELAIDGGLPEDEADDVMDKAKNDAALLE